MTKNVSPFCSCASSPSAQCRVVIGVKCQFGMWTNLLNEASGRQIEAFCSLLCPLVPRRRKTLALSAHPSAPKITSNSLPAAMSQWRAARWVFLRGLLETRRLNLSAPACLSINPGRLRRRRSISPPASAHVYSPFCTVACQQTMSCRVSTWF